MISGLDLYSNRCIQAVTQERWLYDPGDVQSDLHSGSLTQSTPGVPLGVGGWMGGGEGGWFPQGLSCGWVKVIIAPTLLCPLA